MIKFLLVSLLLFNTANDPIIRLPASFINIKQHLKDGSDFTLIYLCKPTCKTSMQNLSKLLVLKQDNHFKVMLLTTATENVSVMKKYHFDTCYYFDPLVYKTHTKDFDEYDQFTNEVFADAKTTEPSNRIRFPAVFVFNRHGKLVYFNEDDYSTELEYEKIIRLKL